MLRDPKRGVVFFRVAGIAEPLQVFQAVVAALRAVPFVMAAERTPLATVFAAPGLTREYDLAVAFEVVADQVAEGGHLGFGSTLRPWPIGVVVVGSQVAVGGVARGLDLVLHRDDGKPRPAVSGGESLVFGHGVNGDVVMPNLQRSQVIHTTTGESLTGVTQPLVTGIDGGRQRGR
jgi:hypothetical protein